MKQRTILVFWLPLFASWLLMTAEGPIVSAAINRLPDEVIMLAAMGIVTSLSVTIESPIINLLATSTALVKDRKSFKLVRRFTIHWILLLTGVTIAIAYTRLFDFLVIDLMGVPGEVAKWIQPGLKIMTLWSAAIGWRRFLQGIMIRFDQTRKVAWGTAIRLISSGGTAISLALWSNLPGVYIGATALMIGVVAEAIFATQATRSLIDNELGPGSMSNGSPSITYHQLLSFHLPLAATSLLILLVQPLVAFSLARLPNPTTSLAAWPVVFQVALISRAPGLALPEVVIALLHDRQIEQPIRRFSLQLAIVNTLLLALLVFTPLIDGYLFGVQDTTTEVGNLARSGLVFFVLLPGLTVLISWVRGLLITRRVTRDINVGMVVNMLVTALILFLGIREQWPGINTAALALSAAAAAEFLYIWWRAGNIFSSNIALEETGEPLVSG